MPDKTDHLKALGSTTKYQYDEPSVDILETFPNNYPSNNYTVTLETNEFTSLCPKTGQPDFGTIIVRYIPNMKCVESKSFKLYMFAFRNYKSFMESMVNKIAEDLITVLQPEFIAVLGKFNMRGGVTITVAREYYEHLHKKD